MQGPRLLIKILCYIAILLAFLMVTLNLFPSWSQYARSLYEPILFATLSSMSTLFMIRSYSHLEFRRTLFKIGKMEVRLGQINRVTGFLFIGILCTPVTHPNDYIQFAHYIFTGLAIFSAYLQLVFYYNPRINRISFISSLLGTIVGIAGFLGAFIFDFYPIGQGELIAALPILILVLSTNT